MWLRNCLVIFAVCEVSAAIQNEFPKDFLLGVATSSYQVEGAWNTSGRGESVWDQLTHNRPEMIDDGSNGDIAADSYHKFKEDVQLIKAMGANTYRFSLSWSRILPNGYPNHISKDGVRYYNNLIDECIRNGIVPIVTLYHWDLPQKLQDLGGWANYNIVSFFESYARVAFRLFGDRVKMWITVNEPERFCVSGYGYNEIIYAPAVNQSGIAEYMCGHNVLLTHARTYAMYEREYRSKQNGQVGIVLSICWYEPADNTSVADIEAAKRQFDFDVGWFAHPLFTSKGDYPETMKTRIADFSRQQGFKRSRLPKFTREQIEDIKGTCDFLGINYYTSFAIRDKAYGTLGYLDDVGTEVVDVKEWKGYSWTKNTPWGLRKMLQTVTAKYQVPDIYITENGYIDDGVLHDVERTTYLHDHLKVLLNVIQNGTIVKGYIIWSLIDNFEWNNGYTLRFGLFHVDFERIDRPRTPKLSSKFITQVYSTRRIPELSNFF